MELQSTAWRRCRGCLKSQVSFRKSATNYRDLFRKMTYKDKASQGSSAPCITSIVVLVVAFVITQLPTTLQHTTTRCSTLQRTVAMIWAMWMYLLQHTAADILTWRRYHYPTRDHRYSPSLRRRCSRSLSEWKSELCAQKFEASFQMACLKRDL